MFAQLCFKFVAGRNAENECQLCKHRWVAPWNEPCEMCSCRGVWSEENSTDRFVQGDGIENADKRNQ